MVVLPSCLLHDYGSGARVRSYHGPGQAGAVRRARPIFPELQGGRSFIMSLHPDYSLGSCWCGVRLPGAGHSQIPLDSQTVPF